MQPLLVFFFHTFSPSFNRSLSFRIGERRFRREHAVSVNSLQNFRASIFSCTAGFFFVFHCLDPSIGTSINSPTNQNRSATRKIGLFLARKAPATEITQFFCRQNGFD